MKIYKQYSDNNEKLQEEAQFQDSRSEGETRTSQVIFYEDVRDASDFFLNKIFEKRPRSILIVGCGDEDVTRYFMNSVEKIIAIDIAPNSIEKVKQFIQEKNLSGHIQAFVMDAHNINLGEQFDMIIGSAALHHLDIKSVLPSFLKFLKPDGWVCFLEPLGMNPFINLYRKITPRARTPHEHPFCKDDIAYMRTFFRDFEMRTFYFLSIFALLFKFMRINGLFRIFWGPLNKIDELIFFVFPGTKYYSWITVILAQK